MRRTWWTWYENYIPLELEGERYAIALPELVEPARGGDYYGVALIVGAALDRIERRLGRRLWLLVEETSCCAPLGEHHLVLQLTGGNFNCPAGHYNWWKDSLCLHRSEDPHIVGVVRRIVSAAYLWQQRRPELWDWHLWGDRDAYYARRRLRRLGHKLAKVASL